MIRNLGELTADADCRRALEILQAGLGAALPGSAVRRFVGGDAIRADGRKVSLAGCDVQVVAFGKAAGLMANAVCDILDVCGGIAVVPHGADGAGSLRTVRASHPVPDQSSVDAALEVARFLARRRSSDFVVFLVSGGSSSLLCRPAGISLEEKRLVSRLLLESGAPIHQLNCVRKHLSGIKGGQLVSGMRCGAASLIMSDVPGDDLSSIASGITYCDGSTFGDALRIVRKYDPAGAMPSSVYRRLETGAAGGIPETPSAPVIPNQIIASNQDCLTAMARRAQDLGYVATACDISGDVAAAAGRIAGMASGRGRCIIFGGETTVRVQGSGSGGRNQELVLRILRDDRSRGRRMVAASIGTDGIDGSTPYAGAVMKNFGIDVMYVDGLLKNSDSHSFFKRHGGLVLTGHTGTNLMDIGLVLT